MQHTVRANPPAPRRTQPGFAPLAALVLVIATANLFNRLDVTTIQVRGA
jgi:hypothetical protein